MRKTGLPSGIVLSTAFLFGYFVVEQRSARPGAEPPREEPKPPKKEEFPVKMGVESTKRDPDGRQGITVNLDIRDPYFLYANPTGNEEVAGKLVLKVSGDGKPEVVEIIYPKGEKVASDIGDYYVYKGKVKLEVVVKRSKDDTDPIVLSINARPLDERGCLWRPMALKQSVP
jgi:hypothetical protein